MKKITLLALAITVTSLTSCKKDRTCVCTYSNAGSSNTSTYITTYTKATKKTAADNCTSGTTYDQSEPAEIQTRVCEIKK